MDTKLRKEVVDDDNKLFFKSNQLLRLFEDWIDDLEPDLRRLRDEMKEEMTLGSFVLKAEALHIIESNWDALLDRAKKSGEELRSLIKRKRDEIQILQDGVGIHTRNSSQTRPPTYCTMLTCDSMTQLYNTIQVREAIKGTKMNEIMLLFTVATILYLPPTFVTVHT